MVIAEPLCIFAWKRNDRPPDVTLVVRYFVHRGLHHRHLTVCVPQPVFIELSHSGTVCNVANEILAFVEVERIYFFCLLDEFRCRVA